MKFEVPESAIKETFLAASGPGGQNVNKVETAVQMRVDISALNLPHFALRKLNKLAGQKMTNTGELLITVRQHRTREANRTEARKRVEEIIVQAHVRDAYRVKTRPSRSSKVKRIENKKKKGSVKKMRGKPSLD